MSKSETIQMLKDAGVEPSKIAMLENGEMAKTEGEFWWFVAPILIGIAGGYAAHRINKDDRPKIRNYPGYEFEYQWRMGYK